jgi:antitoxin VapB
LNNNVKLNLPGKPGLFFWGKKAGRGEGCLALKQGLTRYRSWYILKNQENFMQTARLFINGRSQAVRLPKEYQFNSKNVYIQRVGEAVMLFPVDREWEVFLHGLNGFSDDFMAEGRFQGIDQEREEL